MRADAAGQQGVGGIADGGPKRQQCSGGKDAHAGADDNQRATHGDKDARNAAGPKGFAKEQGGAKGDKDGVDVGQGCRLGQANMGEGEEKQTGGAKLAGRAPEVQNRKPGVQQGGDAAVEQQRDNDKHTGKAGPDDQRGRVAGDQAFGRGIHQGEQQDGGQHQQNAACGGGLGGRTGHDQNIRGVRVDGQGWHTMGNLGI